MESHIFCNSLFIKRLGHVPVNKHFVRDSVCVRGILINNRQSKMSKKMGDCEILMLAAMLLRLNPTFSDVYWS